MDSGKGNISNEPSLSLIDPSIVSTRFNLSAATSKPAEQFLQEPNLSFLESHSSQLRISLVDQILILSLSKLQLNSIGDIGQFEYLQICDLSSNFIESFDSLISNCCQLIKLDLHSNRINRMPDGDLWKSLNKLRILYLHDNLLSSYDDVRSLSNAPVIEVLTLYDTPLSLKKNYRHHVVNSIWSLKALDWHVIADDEIIEKTSFPQPYAAFSSIFKLNLHISTGKNSTLIIEKSNINQLTRQINSIQAHYCPVLILQKNFRMWLVKNRTLKGNNSTEKLTVRFPFSTKRFTPMSNSTGLLSLLNKQRRTSGITDEIFRIERLKSPESSQGKRHVVIQDDNRSHGQGNESNNRSRQRLTKTSTSKYTDERSSPLLRGHKSQMTIYEPIEELNDEIRVARQFVQNIKDESHSQQRKRAAEIKENKTANRQAIRHHTLDDRLLRTLHGSMAFGCLVAIDKAYNDRTKIERRKKLSTEIEQARQEHSFITAQIQQIDDDRLISIHRSKDQDRMRQTYVRRRNEHLQTEIHDLVQEQRRLLLEQQKKRRAQIEFSQNFNSQHISIANALQRHENNVRSQRKVRVARDTVARQKQITEEQSRLIEKYLTQRKHVRRALSNIERKQLDLQAVREASERLFEAQQRVAKIRTRQGNAQRFALMKVRPNTDDLREKASSLTESMIERDSLFDAITDHVAAEQSAR